MLQEYHLFLIYQCYKNTKTKKKTQTSLYVNYISIKLENNLKK